MRKYVSPDMFFFFLLPSTIKSRITRWKNRSKRGKIQRILRDLECWAATNYRTSLRAPSRDWIVWSGSFCIATSWATRRAWKFSVHWHRCAGCKSFERWCKWKASFIPRHGTNKKGRSSFLFLPQGLVSQRLGSRTGQCLPTFGLALGSVRTLREFR